MINQIKKLAPAILKEIKRARRILLHLHPFPDGDSVGSALALYHALRGMGKKVTVIKGDSPRPEYLSFLPGFKEITLKNYLEIDPAEFDLFLILDVSQIKRISNLGEVKFPPELKTVLIDHHQSAEQFAQINLIATDYIATAEILYHLFAAWKIKLTPEIAACLFIGLYTDSGGFKYAKTASRTFAAAAKLVALIPDFSAMIFELENNNSPNQLILEGLALSLIEIIHGGRVALAPISLAVLRAKGLSAADIQNINIANRLKSVKGWEIGATLFEMEPDFIRLSMRTRDPVKFDLSKIALALGGGGHAAAAGAVLKMSLADAKKLLIQKLAECYPLS